MPVPGVVWGRLVDVDLGRVYKLDRDVVSVAQQGTVPAEEPGPAVVSKLPFSGQQDTTELVRWLFDQIGGAERPGSAVPHALSLLSVKN